jgi:hypothetical protein
MRDHKTPERRFQAHKNSAKDRGIEFLLTFEEWWALWEPHWERRGRGSQQMCMCRTADKGGYQVGNVRIATNRENQQERALEYRTTRAQRSYRPKRVTSNGAASLEWTRGRHAFEEYKESV